MEQIKEEMTRYWTQRADGFAQLRKKEFNSKKADLWMAEIQRYLPQGRNLRILDVGTGTGFFALLLARAGHQVVGIDLTEEMIVNARKAAEEQGLAVEFYVMDAEHPEFPAGSFDVVLTRNLTWALPHIDDAYKSWHRLLKKGGVLINFDGDYCREQAGKPLPANHAHKDISQKLVQQYESLKDSLRPLQQSRPQWDVQLLRQAGFHGIQVDTQVWQRVYADVDEFYNPTPIFTISAVA